MKRVLVIGAGPEQCPAIQAALDLGLEVTAVDGAHDAPGLKLAHRGLCLDIADSKAVIDLARDLRIEALVPAPVGRLLTTVGAVNTALGLRGLSLESARLCTDKALAHRVLRAGGVRVARQVRLDGSLSIGEAIAEVGGLPVVIKPVRGSGSRGVQYLSTDIEVSRCGLTAAEVASGDWLIEEALQGIEFGVDAALYGDRFQTLLIREKIMTDPPARQEMVYLHPPRVPAAIVAGIEAAVQAAARALGFSDCLINADVMVSPAGEAAIIEIVGRPAGNNVSARILPALTGENPVTYGLRCLGGKPVAPPPAPTRPLCHAFLPLKAGRVICIQLPDVSAIHEVLGLECPVQPGQTLTHLATGADAFARGWIMTTGVSASRALGLAREIISRIEVNYDQSA